MTTCPGRSMPQHDGRRPVSTDHTVPPGRINFPNFPGISCLATIICPYETNPTSPSRPVIRVPTRIQPFAVSEDEASGRPGREIRLRT